MKRRIIISLSALFMLFAAGAAVSSLYIKDNAIELERIIRLHEVEQLRRTLLINLQAVQSGLYKIETPLDGDVDSIVNNVIGLEQSAEGCFSCHHPPRVKQKLEDIQILMHNYRRALSGYISASSDRAKLDMYKKKATGYGSSLLSITKNMSHDASRSLNHLKDTTSARLSRAKMILLITLFSTFLLAVLAAVLLTKSITRPVSELVKATRLIKSGKLGTIISYRDKNEFGELAENFNNMSTAIKDGYEKIQEEIRERWQAEDALIESESFLRTIFDSIRDPFCIIDHNYKILKANEAYAELRNKSVEDLTGRTCYDVLRNKQYICKDCIVHTTFQSLDPCAREKRLILEDGSKIWMEIYTYPIFNKDGKATHVIEYIRDITDRKLAIEALRESEERYVLAARGANDGLWDWDLKSNTVYYSPRLKSMLGFDEHEIKDSPDEWIKRIHPDDRMQVEAEIAAHIRGRSSHFESEHRLRHRNGEYLWVLSRGLAVFDSSSKAVRMAGSITDITERKSAEEQLMFDALHDSLTGLPNRTLFMDRLSHMVEREKRKNDCLFAVVFFDLNRFKVLNDSLGHLTGDKLLVAISHRLLECLRPSDTIARFGGDEFAVLLEDLKDRDEAAAIVKRLMKKIAAPFVLDGHEVFTSASMGVTFSSTGYDKPEHILRDADIAMYHAKSEGNNQYKVFDRSMYDDALTRLQTENELRQAVKCNEFTLHYQPVVSTKTGRITGFEALIRWLHPDRGMVQPSEFIPIAEETGLIISIGEWAIREACRQLKTWQDEFQSDPPLTVSVNISSRQLLPNLVKHIETVLEETDIQQGSMILEITESMLMENSEYLTPLLLKLKNMDVKLHIDDFGKGYSSLSYLRFFPIDALKIDRSFISRLCHDRDNLEIVKAIIALSHTLNMNVIAEGVESEEQISRLNSLKCDLMQGYFFSRPLESGESGNLLRKSWFDLIRYLEHKN